VRKFTGHSDAITVVAFSPTLPGIIASASADSTIKVSAPAAVKMFVLHETNRFP
jgi:hypothetical protein